MRVERLIRPIAGPELGLEGDGPEQGAPEPSRRGRLTELLVEHGHVEPEPTPESEQIPAVDLTKQLINRSLFELLLMRMTGVQSLAIKRLERRLIEERKRKGCGVYVAGAATEKLGFFVDRVA